MNKYLALLHKKFKQKVKRTENSLTRLIVKVEIKVNKISLKIVKHEASGTGMSSISDG